MKQKNKTLLRSFVTYCNSHPDERFWQALRNWSGHQFIYTNDELCDSCTDTFYWTKKTKPTNLDLLKYETDYSAYFDL